MQYLAGDSLEKFEPRDILKLKKKVRFFDRAALATLWGGSSIFAATITGGIITVSISTANSGQPEGGGLWFLGSIVTLAIGVPSLLRLVVSWGKYSELLKKKELELERDPELDVWRRSELDSDLDDPLAYYRRSHLF